MASSESVVVGDLDGDELPDLVAANMASNNVAVFLGQGGGVPVVLGEGRKTQGFGKAAGSFADRALAALEAHPVPFMLGFNRRFDPDNAALRRVVQAGGVLLRNARAFVLGVQYEYDVFPGIPETFSLFLAPFFVVGAWLGRREPAVRSDPIRG